MSEICSHDVTTETDPEGWVICFGCGLAIKRPLRMDELVERLEGR